MAKTLKFTSTLLVILLCVICCTFHIYAMDAQVFEGSSTATLTYRQASTYCILIPAYIDMSDTYTFSAENINITDDEIIAVTVTNVDENNRIKFTHESGKYTLTKNIEQVALSDNTSVSLPLNCVGAFVGDDTASIIGFRLSQDSYDYTRTRAGMYSAVVEFSVSLMSK